MADERDAKEPEIIRWCGDNNAVWIHADDSAKRQHRAILIAHQTRTLWVQREKGKLSARDQLRIVSYVLPQLLANYASRPSQRHYRAWQHGPPDLKHVSLQVFEIK